MDVVEACLKSCSEVGLAPCSLLDACWGTCCMRHAKHSSNRLARAQALMLPGVSKDTALLRSRVQPGTADAFDGFKGFAFTGLFIHDSSSYIRNRFLLARPTLICHVITVRSAPSAVLS